MIPEYCLKILLFPTVLNYNRDSKCYIKNKDNISIKLVDILYTCESAYCYNSCGVSSNYKVAWWRDEAHILREHTAKMMVSAQRHDDVTVTLDI